MKKNNVNPLIVISAFFVFAISVGLSIFYIFSINDSNNKFSDSYNKDEVNELRNILKYQEQTDYDIKKALKDKNYTFDNPYIVENPYMINPLSAIIAFTTSTKESIDVFINDEFVYTVNSSYEHIIPIYGLFNNAVNIIKLKMNNHEHEIEIKTNLYNFDHDGIDISELIDDKTHYFLIGNTNKQDSNLRGFDRLGSLIYYLDLDYISSVKFYNSKLYVGYNSKYSKSSKMRDIKLEMNYLGKIYSISTNLTDLDEYTLIDNGNPSDNFYGNQVNLYPDKINNVDLSKATDNLKYTDYERIATREIESSLENAKIYDKKFLISINGDYLTYDIDEEGMLVFVNKNTFNTYMYEINNTNIIKIEPLGKSSLYLYINGEYYDLLTTISK